MKLYEKLYTRIKNDIILAPGMDTGILLPTRTELMSRFGGSTRPMMRAILELEKSGLVNRVSPRKFSIVAKTKENTHKNGVEELQGNIGLINFEGHLFSNFAHNLIPRLYDRQLRPMLMPFLGSRLEMERITNRFFEFEFKALLVHDFNLLPASLLKNCKHLGMFIQLFFPYNIMPMESHCLFIDESFFMYDALSRLFRAGYKHVMVFDSATPPQGYSHPRNQRLTGIEKFRNEFMRGNSDFKLEYTGSFGTIKYDESLACKWAKELSPKTEAIVCTSDFQVIKAREWIMRYSKLDYRNILFTGYGNTDWSSVGPEPFPSYDFRLDDFLSMTLELLDSPPDKPISKHIKPRPTRMNLINEQINQ